MVYCTLDQTLQFSRFWKLNISISAVIKYAIIKKFCMAQKAYPTVFVSTIKMKLQFSG